LVKNIQAGCDLYKQAKESFVEIKRTGEQVVAIGKEVKGVFGFLRNLFNAAPKSNASQPLSKSKKSDYVSFDETEV